MIVFGRDEDVETAVLGIDESVARAERRGQRLLRARAARYCAAAITVIRLAVQIGEVDGVGQCSGGRGRGLDRIAFLRRGPGGLHRREWRHDRRGDLPHGQLPRLLDHFAASGKALVDSRVGAVAGAGSGRVVRHRLHADLIQPVGHGNAVRPAGPPYFDFDRFLEQALHALPFFHHLAAWTDQFEAPADILRLLHVGILEIEGEHARFGFLGGGIGLEGNVQGSFEFPMVNFRRDNTMAGSQCQEDC